MNTQKLVSPQQAVENGESGDFVEFAITAPSSYRRNESGNKFDDLRYYIDESVDPHKHSFYGTPRDPYLIIRDCPDGWIPGTIIQISGTIFMRGLDLYWTTDEEGRDEMKSTDYILIDANEIVDVTQASKAIDAL